ncbi:hypothetical protein SAMN06265360_10749 [Haloechinothrix alba]|uniref:DUF445 domain-containing protein n=1 Tax=Haloechinothrix alba TaxID=664784 RepID=A0A238WPR0_9PSEU|nr:hypothetical protein [Haloechinothrix alba]SNR48371.1 hypothetical protein SAMN06265360_10749 [Haloechinothrix alba]
MTVFGMDVDTGTLLIPVFAGLIGYATNWLAIKMMFKPIDFAGWKMPFRILGFPVFGWQGIIPSKAAKMGSIAVDTGLAKLGTMSEFYRELDPEELAAQIVKTSRSEIHSMIDDIIAREYPDLWAQLPLVLKQAVHSRIEAELPDAVRRVTDEMGEHIDRLVDLKLMVIRHMEANPRLMNRIFLEVGAKEFRFIIRSGAVFGFVLGVIPMLMWQFAPQWWTVPLGAAVVGYLTNWLALKVIFTPVNPVKIGPFTVQGLFLRRQAEVSDVYSGIIAHEVVTMSNIAAEMFHGPDGDRTYRLIADTLRPIVDRTVGVARPMVRAATGSHYDAIQRNIAAGTVGHTIESLTDEEFVKGRAEKLHALLAGRMRELPPEEFADMLRSAFREDEWQLIVVGAALGFLAGLLQLSTTL